MTDDEKFEDVAHREAQSRHGCGMSPSEVSDRVEFRAGAAWARDHLARQEVTDAEVQAGAFAIAVRSEDIEEWDSLSTYSQGQYRNDARAALTAARTVRQEQSHD